MNYLMSPGEVLLASCLAMVTLIVINNMTKISIDRMEGHCLVTIILPLLIAQRLVDRDRADNFDRYKVVIHYTPLYCIVLYSILSLLMIVYLIPSVGPPCFN